MRPRSQVKVKFLETTAPGWPAHPVPVQGAPEITVRMHFRVTSIEDRNYHMIVHFVMAERDTGKPIEFDINVWLPQELWAEREPNREKAVRHALKTALLHEIDESIVKNGSRPFDPHPKPEFEYYTDDEGPHY